MSEKKDLQLFLLTHPVIATNTENLLSNDVTPMTATSAISVNYTEQESIVDAYQDVLCFYFYLHGHDATSFLGFLYYLKLNRLCILILIIYINMGAYCYKRIIIIN